ncbi:VWA domain-containing protein [uncultured Methanobrevibacter sp.]|uniref:VWA domain-containing protein n=1 Tax=uncultured Methanobrevibacter sp. TaxID=253161 RepID=UPI0026077549
MEERIVKLSNQLRKEGIPVSIRSTQSAIDTYNILGDDDVDTLRDAFRSIYVKSKYDIPKFDESFNGFFVKKKVNSLTEELNRANSPTSMRGKLSQHEWKISKQKGSGAKQIQMGAEQAMEYFSGSPVLEDRNKDLARDNDILNSDLSKLNKFDQRVFELCVELGRKIANKQSRRKRLAHSNKIDIRRTMRNNMKYGGVPIDLVEVKKKPHRKQHLFLNDVSGSCEWISSWFFMLMYACQKSFKDSRMFEFDNKTIETTEFLKEKYMVNAFAEIRLLRMRNMMVRGTSNMFTAFESFMRQAEISNKSYVIILSDCRDWAGPKVDGVPASVESISKMSSKAKKVIILNPEDKKKWDVVDSCVSLYRGAGAQVYEVSTLNQLAEFVAEM